MWILISYTPSLVTYAKFNDILYYISKVYVTCYLYVNDKVNRVNKWYIIYTRGGMCYESPAWSRLRRMLHWNLIYMTEFFKTYDDMVTIFTVIVPIPIPNMQPPPSAIWHICGLTGICQSLKWNEVQKCIGMTYPIAKLFTGHIDDKCHCHIFFNFDPIAIFEIEYNIR